MPLVVRGGSLLTAAGKLSTNEGCCCGCPTADQCTLTLSDVATNCGCIDLSALIESASFHYTANPFNSIFTVPFSFAGTGWVLYAMTVVTSFYEASFDSNDCSGTNNGQDEAGFGIEVLCFDDTNDQGVDPGHYVVIYAGPSFQSVAYYSGNVSGWSSLANTSVCGELTPDDTFLDWDGGVRIGSTSGGSASLTFP